MLFLTICSIIICYTAILTIFASNPIHAMLFLILLFVNVSGLFFYFGLDYLALMLLIVYVGAINVLFLFIIMMLNIKILVSKFNFFKIIPIGGFFIIILFWLLLNDNKYLLTYNYTFNINWFNILYLKTNIEYIGYYLINDYISLLIISGFILLLAMIAATILTFKSNIITNNKKQIIITQLKRKGVLNLFK